jgi:hypothetical protein
MPKLEPMLYEFGLDDKIDSKLYPSLLRTAYTAVIGAKLREEGRTEPLFDFDDEPAPESTYDPEVDGLSEPRRPLTYGEAQHFASAIYRKAVSQGRHEDGRWLLGMTKRNVTKDEATGEYHVSLSTETPIKDIHGFITDELARTPEDSSWFASLIFVRQTGIDVPLWHEGINEANVVFNEWLGAIPWTRDDISETRKERVVGRCADRKWEALKLAAKTKNERQVSKLLDDWTLLAHSPKLRLEVDHIVASPMYKAHAMQQTQLIQLAELEKLEMEAMLAETMADIKKTSELIKARGAEIAARIAAVAPAKVEESKDEAPKAQPKSLKPRVIASRRAA